MRRPPAIVVFERLINYGIRRRSEDLAQMRQQTMAAIAAVDAEIERVARERAFTEWFSVAHSVLQ